MQTLKSITPTVGEEIHLECRATLKRRRLSRNGLDCLPVYLEDISGGVTAFIVPANEIGSLRINSAQPVSVSMRVEEGITPYLRIIRIKPFESGAANPVRTIPASWCPQPELLRKLDQAVNSLRYFPVIQFVEDFFSTDSLVKPYISLPASVDCHHAFKGGLLAHSINCAQRVWGFLSTDDPLEREIAVVAALLHDVGKIRTLTAEGKYQRSALLMDHRVYTLEILAPFLNQLEQIDPDTSNLLRYVWSWQSSNERIDPLAAIAIAVQAADAYSAKKDAEKRAFASKPTWQQRATYRGKGPVRHFWRRRPDSQIQIPMPLDTY